MLILILATSMQLYFAHVDPEACDFGEITPCPVDPEDDDFGENISCSRKVLLIVWNSDW